MQPYVHAVLMAINYSHDIAAALLATSGAALWMLSSTLPVDATPATERFFIDAYRGVTRIAKDSLYWILLAGVPRVVFYMQYEWSDLAGDLQIVSVVIKHVVLVLLVGSGIYLWIRIGRQVKARQQRDGSV